MTTAKITIELEITVSGEADSAYFDVTGISAVTGYNSATKVWTMSQGFDPDKLAELVQAHFASEALTAIEEQEGEDVAAYLDAQADQAYENAWRD
jgi:hypothetical protein